ncbi:DivIVA domain-containing protein [bacterium]|nr:DivIVA domain-containing protein [bacterium]
MRITPIDIAHKSFQRKMMGLDPDQVMDFLRFVADEMETVIRERNALKEALREKDISISEYRERDELLKNTITTATRMSERMQSDADRESKLILQDANQKAEMIVRDARDSLKRIYQDISDLKRVRLQFENNLKALIQSHMAMVEQGQKIMPNPSLDPTLGIDEEVSSKNQQEIERRVSEAVTAKSKSAEF